MNDFEQRIAGMSPKRLALLAIELSERLEASERELSEPIALVGMACRFPGGVDSPEAFWRLLHDGVDAITEVPRDRFDVDAWYDPDPEKAGKMSTRWGGFVDAIDRFDAGFFGITPREAMAMDPQHRLLLETAWEALERAGHVPARLHRSETGVYLGIMQSDYWQLSYDAGPASLDVYSGTGVGLSFAAGRLSYLLGLQGPCMAIDTACSSALVAVHLACQALRRRECDLALAGGVNAVLSPVNTVYDSRIRAMAPDGRCKAFDASADGFVRAEGCGVVVLRRLSDALAAGDTVLALVRGSAVNHAGPSGGLTVPSGPSQEAVIRRALISANVSPAEVDFVEAHGTGTALGDPIEMRVLGAVMGEGRAPGERFVVGSVKTNIGHAESAAGVAGLIKTVLAMQHGEIPPNLHFNAPSPHIAWSELAATVPTTVLPWPAREGRVRIAGISSFGMSGVNAHVVLEEPPAPVATRPVREDTACLLPLSARSPDALRALAKAHLAVVNTAASLHDLGYTLALRRSHHAHRAALVARDRESLREQLTALAQDEPDARMATGVMVGGRRPRVAFVLSGQGPQWWGMGRALQAGEPVFREALARCDAALSVASEGWSLRDELARDEATCRLDQTVYAQPALFALQVALAAQWAAWGVEPAMIVGHSIGEVAAAHLSGALTLEAAARVAVQRGRVMQRATDGGSMASVELPRADVEAALRAYEGRVSLAAVNAPASVVVAGERDAVARFVAALSARGVAVRALRVRYAFHSAQMDPFEPVLRSALAGLASRTPTVPVVSTCTGAPGAAFDAAYWGQQMRAPVRFADAVATLLREGCDAFVELGPHPVLAPALAQCAHAAGARALIVPSLRRGADDRETLLGSLGALHARGASVAWDALYPDGALVADAPTYPWQRERYWIDPVRAIQRIPDAADTHPLLGRHATLAHPAGTHVWETAFDEHATAYLRDHRVQGSVVVPGTAYIEMGLAAGGTVFAGAGVALAEVEFHKMMALPAQGGRIVQTLLAPDGADAATFRVFSRAATGARDDAWTLHASGRIVATRAVGAA